jgi:CheY-like chemotaxis protein
VQRLHGRLWVESALGQGSTFHFTACLGLAPHPVAIPGAAAPERLHNLPVLVVDDNATNRRILVDLLSRWQMRPSAVDSAVAALTALQQAAAAATPFPLILLDAMMPEMDGFTLAAQIQAHPELAGATIMMLTSGSRREDAARCQALGIRSHLLKPITQTELREAILAALHMPLATATAAAAPRYEARYNRGQNLHVLLVEDNPVNQKVAARMLDKQGYTTRVVGDGKAALAALAQERFDIVLMDVQMPVMGGFETTAAIREAERHTGAHLPIIALTAHAMKGDQEQCLAAGMDAYLAKPIKASALYATIQRLLG